jgi:GT2 family glycosyltransferase
MGTGIVIVTYNSESVAGACLDSCAREAPGAPVVVVDNASLDGTLEQVRRRNAVRLIVNRENRGFAAAVNQGVEALAGCERILLLNPDAEIVRGVAALEEICGRAGVGAAAGCLAGSGGAPQAGFGIRRLPTPATLAFEALGINRVWPGNPVNRRYRCAGFDWTRESDVEQPAGAFLMFRREAWRRIGGFDERFHPAWFEDVDFCRRLLEAGYRIRYTPAAVARHAGGHSAAGLPWEWRERFWYASLLKYGAKHFRAGGRLAAGLAVMLGSVLRFVLAAVGGKPARDALRVYGGVIGLAAGSLRGCGWLARPQAGRARRPQDPGVE